MHTLQHLFTSQLQDAYSAETQLVEALPKMAEAAETAELKSAINKHLTETNRQVERLKKVCELAGCDPEGETCEAMEGLIAEGEEMIDQGAESHVRDAGLIAAAQKVEHYEIALYGTLSAWAKELGMDEAARLLHETLEEEKRTDQALTKLAEARVNLQARR